MRMNQPVIEFSNFSFTYLKLPTPFGVMNLEKSIL